MKFLFDLFPVICLFGMYKWGEGHPDAAQSLLTEHLSGVISGGIVSVTQAPIILATAVAIIATICQIGYLLIRGKKVDTMLWLSFGIISIFGGATIYFHNPTFIKWKPTVLYWCFGVALIFSQVVLKQNMIRVMLEEQITLPDLIWQRLSAAWAAFFVTLGFLNLFVAFNPRFTEADWVNFKLFGFTGLMFAFVIAQSLYLAKHVQESE
jgi:intracellular septation protein